MKNTWSRYYRAMGVAKRYSCPHGNEFVHKKHAGFKHLFMDENRSLNLCGNNSHDAGQIRRESRPGRIVNFGDHAAQIAIYLECLLCRDGKAGSVDGPADSEFSERNLERPHVTGFNIGDGDASVGNRSKADKRANFHVIRTNTIIGTAKALLALDRQDV